ncbi:MAG: allophanate hydrolase subunit 1 [Nocardioides sp.]|nr:allophanate hydrolase subunit 1 [Nocardioides sp.]
MRLIPFGPDATLLEVADATEALDLALWLRERVDAREIVPAAATVLVSHATDDLASVVGQWTPSGGLEEGSLVEVPVTYDGPDLTDVADHWGVPVDEVVSSHVSAHHVAAFSGFAPGFAYLAHDGGWDDVPRRAAPRSRVEPGSVGLAGPYTGIYPTASPGGWQLIGHTDIELWDQDREPPALLAPGTRVRFVAR